MVTGFFLGFRRKCPATLCNENRRPILVSCSPPLAGTAVIFEGALGHDAQLSSPYVLHFNPRVGSLRKRSCQLALGSSPAMQESELCGWVS